MLHLGLEGITEVDTDPEGRFVSFKVTTSLCAPSGEQLTRERFFEGLQNYMQNENEGNENKMDMDRDGENKAQRLYRCCYSYALSKLIVGNALEDYGEGRTQIPLSSSATIDPLPRIQDRQGLY